MTGGERTDFAELYGGDPAGVWFAPGRVNLIGEHTDYNDGFVLPFALAQRTTVAARRLDEPQWTVWSETAREGVTFGLDQLHPKRRHGWIGYVEGIVWALQEAGHDVAGAQLFVESDVPPGAGLSSSAALECAVLEALCELSELAIPAADRPRLAQHAENGYAGIPCGIMDQSAAVLCQAGHALFLDCRSLSTEQVPFDPAAAGLTVLVLDSRAPHQHVTGEYAARRATCEQAAHDLGVPALRDIGTADLDAALARLDNDISRRRVRHVVTENQRVRDTVARLAAGDVAGIGPLLTASHGSMRDDYEITVPQVDLAVEIALQAGAHGARMTGGGFGGCVLALVDTDRVPAVTTRVTEAFAAAGFTEPTWFAATPAEGAGRLT